MVARLLLLLILGGVTLVSGQACGSSTRMVILGWANVTIEGASDYNDGSICANPFPTTSYCAYMEFCDTSANPPIITVRGIPLNCNPANGLCATPAPTAVCATRTNCSNTTLLVDGRWVASIRNPAQDSRIGLAYNMGTYTITYTATGLTTCINGTTRATIPCSRRLVVRDTRSPAINLSGDPVVFLESGANYSDAGVSAFDAVDGTMPLVLDPPCAVNFSFNPPRLTGFPGRVCRINPSDATASASNTLSRGNVTIFYVAVDSSGNQNQVMRTLVLSDTIPPVLLPRGCAANDTICSINVAGGTRYIDQGATSVDRVDGNLTDRIVRSIPVNTNLNSQFNVIYNSRDLANNSAAPRRRLVRISDSVPPSLTLRGSINVTVECATPYIEQLAVAYDDIDGELTDQIIMDISLRTNLPCTRNCGNESRIDTFAPSRTSWNIDYRVFDSSNNFRQVSRTVTLIDTTPPVLTLLGPNPQNVEGASQYVEPGYTATDTLDDTPSLVQKVIVRGNFTTFAPAWTTFVRAYELKDTAGNSAVMRYRTLIIGDGTPPRIFLLGQPNVVVESGAIYEEVGVIANDTLDTPDPTAPYPYFPRASSRIAESVAPVAVPTCTSGQFIAVPATGDTLLRCANYAVTCSSSQYETAPRTATSDRVCTPLSPPCSLGSPYELQSPTATSDRVCETCNNSGTLAVPSAWPTPVERPCFRVQAPPSLTWRVWNNATARTPESRVFVINVNDTVIWEFDENRFAVVSGTPRFVPINISVNQTNVPVFHYVADGRFSSLPNATNGTFFTGFFGPKYINGTPFNVTVNGTTFTTWNITLAPPPNVSMTVFRVTFNTTGNYTFFSPDQPNMTSVVVVRASPFYNSCNLSTPDLAPTSNSSLNLRRLIANLTETAKRSFLVTLAPQVQNTSGLCRHLAASDLDTVLYRHIFPNGGPISSHLIVVSSVNNTLGTLEVSRDAGINWQPAALPLTLDTSVPGLQRLRLRPDPFRFGTAVLTYAFQWATPVMDYSVYIAYASLAVTPVNSPPLLGPFTITDIDQDLEEDDPLFSGVTIIDLVNASYFDPDRTGFVGVAVVGVDNRFGTWQWTCEVKPGWDTTPYTSFVPFVGTARDNTSLPSPSQATLLANQCRIRFLANRHFNTELDELLQARPFSDRPRLSLRAWDGTGATANSTGVAGVDTTRNAGLAGSPFGDVIQTTSLIVYLPTTPSPLLVIVDGNIGVDLETTYVRGAGRQTLMPKAYVDFPSSLSITTIFIVVTNTADNTAEQLFFNVSRTQVNASVVYGNRTITLTLTAANGVSAPITEFNRVLQSLQYQHTAINPTAGDRIITLQAALLQPGSSTFSDRSFVTVIVQAPNDPPLVLVHASFPQTTGTAKFLDYNASTLLCRNASISDIDSPQLASMVVTVDSPMPFEFLSVANISGLQAVFNRTTVTLTITPVCAANATSCTAPPSLFTAALRTLLYQYPIFPPPPPPPPVPNATACELYLNSTNSSMLNTTIMEALNCSMAGNWSNSSNITTTTTPIPTTTTTPEPTLPPPITFARIVTVTVSDGLAASNATISLLPATTTVPPLLDINGAASGTDGVTNVFVQGQTTPVNIMDSQTYIITVDTDTLVRAEVTLINDDDCTTEQLACDRTLAQSLGVSCVYSTGLSRLVISGPANSSSYARLLRTVTYLNTAAVPRTQPRIFTVFVFDGTSVSATRTCNVTFSLINAAPVLDPLAGPTAYTVAKDMDDFANMGFSVSELIGTTPALVQPRGRFTVLPCTNGCSYAGAEAVCRSQAMGMCSRAQVNDFWTTTQPSLLAWTADLAGPADRPVRTTASTSPFALDNWDQNQTAYAFVASAAVSASAPTFSAALQADSSLGRPVDALCCAIDAGRTVSVAVSAQGLSGTITLSQVSPVHPTMVRVSLLAFDGLLNSIQINQFAPAGSGCSDVGDVFNPLSVSEIRCGAANPALCAVGNIVARQPTLAASLTAGAVIDLEFSDLNLPLFGANSIVGRALMLSRAAPAPTVCLPLTLLEPTRTVRFAFAAPAAGSIEMSQALADPTSDTLISTVFAADTAFNGSTANWFATTQPDPLSFSCASATPYDPMNATTDPSYAATCAVSLAACAPGDLTGKFRTLSVTGNARKVVTDPTLGLTSDFIGANPAAVVRSTRSGTTVCATPAANVRRALAPIQHQDVVGSVLFTQTSPTAPLQVAFDLYSHTTPSFNLLAGGQVFIYSGTGGFGTDACNAIGTVFDPDARNTCNPAQPQNCRVGDLSVRRATNVPMNPSSGFTITFSMSDTSATLYGANTIVNRALVITRRDTGQPWICAPIQPRGLVTVAQARFTYPLAGTVTFAQAAGDSTAETFVTVDLAHVDNSNLTTTHAWRVHANSSSCSCDSAGAVLDTQVVPCSLPDTQSCAVGNIFNRLGAITVVGVVRTQRSFIDTALPLDGPASILGRSLVIYNNPAGSSVRYACATITAVPTRTATAVLDGDSYFGSVRFSQAGPLAPTRIEVTLSGLSSGAPWSLAFTPLPAGIQQLATGEWVPQCSTAILNPAGAASCSINLIRRSSDQCPLGDFSGKFGTFSTRTVKRTVFDRSVSLYGPNSILGRGVTLRDASGAQTTCSSILEASPVTAEVVFGGSLGRITFTRVGQDVAVYSQLTSTLAPTSWFISANTSCGANMPRLNPTGVGSTPYLCTPSMPNGCALGDLQGRLGSLTGATQYMLDSQLNLTQAIGRTLVVVVNNTAVCGVIRRTDTPALTDVDANSARGIAVTSTNATFGRWQYRTWLQPAWTNIPAVSPAAALRLSENPGNRLRFVPTAGFNGDFTCARCPQPHPNISCVPCSPSLFLGTLSFVGWDQTDFITDGSIGSSAYSDAGAYSAASKRISMTLAPGIVNGSAPSGSRYTVTFSVFDNAGNSASAVRNITVTDSTFPTLTVRGTSAVTIEAALPYVDLGATAFDSRDKDITNRVTVVGVSVQAPVPALPTPTAELVMQCTARPDSVFAGAPLLAAVDAEMPLPETEGTFGAGRVVDCVLPPQNNAATVCVAFDDVVSFYQTALVRTYLNANLSDPNIAGNLTQALAAWPWNVLNTTTNLVTTLCSASNDTLSCYLPDSLQTAQMPDAVKPLSMICTREALPTDCKFYPEYLNAKRKQGSVTTVSTMVPSNSTYNVTYMVADAAGNAVRRSRTVTVVDTTPPMLAIPMPGALTLEYNTTVEPFTPFRTRMVAGSCPISNTSHLAYNEVNLLGCAWAWDTLDANVSCSVTVLVAKVNLSSPLMSTRIRGDLYFRGDCAAGMLGSTEVIDCDVILGGLDLITPHNELGTTFLIRYGASDRAGNQVSTTRSVTIVDTTAPELHFRSFDPITVGYLGTYNATENVTAFDVHDGDVTSFIVVTGEVVNTVIPGEYSLSYSVVDLSQNQGPSVPWKVIVRPQPNVTFQPNTAYISLAVRILGVNAATFNSPALHTIFRAGVIRSLRTLTSTTSIDMSAVNIVQMVATDVPYANISSPVFPQSRSTTASTGSGSGSGSSNANRRRSVGSPATWPNASHTLVNVQLTAGCGDVYFVQTATNSEEFLLGVATTLAQNQPSVFSNIAVAHNATVQSYNAQCPPEILVASSQDLANKNKSDNSFPAWAIAVIIVAVLAFVVLGFLLYRWRRNIIVREQLTKVPIQYAILNIQKGATLKVNGFDVPVDRRKLGKGNPEDDDVGETPLEFVRTYKPPAEEIYSFNNDNLRNAEKKQSAHPLAEESADDSANLRGKRAAPRPPSSIDFGKRDEYLDISPEDEVAPPRPAKAKAAVAPVAMEDMYSYDNSTLKKGATLPTPLPDISDNGSMAVPGIRRNSESSSDEHTRRMSMLGRAPPPMPQEPPPFDFVASEEGVYESGESHAGFSKHDRSARSATLQHAADELYMAQGTLPKGVSLPKGASGPVTMREATEDFYSYDNSTLKKGATLPPAPASPSPAPAAAAAAAAAVPAFVESEEGMYETGLDLNRAGFSKHDRSARSATLQEAADELYMAQGTLPKRATLPPLSSSPPRPVPAVSEDIGTEDIYSYDNGTLQKGATLPPAPAPAPAPAPPAFIESEEGMYETGLDLNRAGFSKHDRSARSATLQEAADELYMAQGTLPKRATLPPAPVSPPRPVPALSEDIGSEDIYSYDNSTLKKGATLAPEPAPAAPAPAPAPASAAPVFLESEEGVYETGLDLNRAGFSKHDRSARSATLQEAAEELYMAQGTLPKRATLPPASASPPRPAPVVEDIVTEDVYSYDNSTLKKGATLTPAPAPAPATATAAAPTFIESEEGMYETGLDLNRAGFSKHDRSDRSAALQEVADELYMAQGTLPKRATLPPASPSAGAARALESDLESGPESSSPPPRPPPSALRTSTLPPKASLSHQTSSSSLQSASSPPPLPGSRASTLPPRSSLPPPPPPDAPTASMSKLAHVFRGIARKEAEQLLRDAGLVDGIFLFRQRENEASVALTLFAMPDIFEHHILTTDPATGRYLINGEALLQPCVSLEDVMAHLRRVPDKIGVPLGKIVAQ